MTIKSKTKRLIVLTVGSKKGYENILLQPGATVSNENIKESDIAPYGDDIEEIKAELKEPEFIKLPDEITTESLKTLPVKDLKRWCKENEVKKYSSLNEDDLIALILGAIEAKELALAESKKALEDLENENS